MTAQNGLQLPSIDYVLSTLGISPAQPAASADTPRAPTPYERSQNALTQWGDTLTVSHAPTKCAPAPQSSRGSQQEPMGMSHQRNCDSGVSHAGFGQARICMPAASTPSATRYSPHERSQAEHSHIVSPHEVRLAPASYSTQLNSAVMVPQHTASGAMFHTTAPWPEPTDLTRSNESAGGDRRRPSRQETRKFHPRTTELVVDQLANCRERLSEINFRAIERPDGLLQCSLCQEAYRTKTLVTRHAVSHLKDPKPFTCSICNKRFSRCDTLYRHCKRKACKVELSIPARDWEDSCYVLNATKAWRARPDPIASAWK